MITYPLRNLTSNRVIASRVGYASNFFSRFVGLLGKSEIDLQEGLWLPRCDSVHMMGMRVELDLVFVDANGIVLKKTEKAECNKPFFRCAGAKSVIELAVGASSVISVGDRIELNRS